MERELLRKVQLTQLEIAKEIKRVCQENGIRVFLADGTMLGAVRHQGFIPWDDDMDVGMLREDYEKFCKIAPEKLNPAYCLQSWYTDPNYALPFAKIRKRNTVYQEDKSTVTQEIGFYVDIFPYDYALPDPQEQRRKMKKLNTLYRLKLMKSGYRPWVEADSINYVKRLGYIPYQIASAFCSKDGLARKYDALVAEGARGDLVYEQDGLARDVYFPGKMFESYKDYSFEQVAFPGVADYDQYLTLSYGDYMELPPEDERENRHLIVKVDFGE